MIETVSLNLPSESGLHPSKNLAREKKNFLRIIQPLLTFHEKLRKFCNLFDIVRIQSEGNRTLYFILPCFMAYDER